MGTELRVSPSEKSLMLRTVQPTDKVKYLRSEGEWYEVDIESKDAQIFRGWLKGSLPLEKIPQAPVKAAEPQRVERTSPLTSEKFLWFWTGKISDKGQVQLGVGLGNITYKLEGTLASGNSSTIYQYDFLGFTLDTFIRYNLLEYPFGSKYKLSWGLGGGYTYGLFRLTFSPDFTIGELRGKGYTVTTNTYDFDMLFRFHFQPPQGKVHFDIGIGPTFYYYEVAPDLEENQSFKQAVFGDLTVQGLGLPSVALNVQAKKLGHFGLRVVPLLLLADISEDAVVNPPFDVSGFPPTLFQLLLGYPFATHWMLSGRGDYFFAEAKSTGAGTRVGRDYTDGKVSLGMIRGSVGIRYVF
jgi:hypothetical protein